MQTKKKIKYPGIPITTNGNLLVSFYTESLIADAGVFYPITPSTEQGEAFQMNYAKGQLNAFGESTIAIETEGEHAAQGGAIAFSVTGKRVVNFTSGQGIVYGMEQYYHAPGKLSTMVLEVGARALTKHALNVHCGHDDIYSVLDTGWILLMAKDAQQAADQALILRRVTELALNPGINAQDGFLTTHVERKFLRLEPELIREFLGHPSDLIDCPTKAQEELFGKQRRRVPEIIDLKNPILLGPVQNQEHYMNGIAARRNNFSEPILGFLEKSYEDFATLTGRKYGLISKYNCEKSDTIFIALGSAVENIEAAIDYIKETRNEEVGVIHINVIRPFPENEVIKAIKGKKNVIVLERADDSLSPDNPLTRDIRATIDKAVDHHLHNAYDDIEKINPLTEKPRIFSGVYGLGSRDFRPENILGAYDFCLGKTARQDGKTIKDGERFFFLGIDHDYAVISNETPSLLPEKSTAVRFHSIGGWGMITTGKNLGEILTEISDYVAIKDGLLDEHNNPDTVIHVSANPRYGSEKKGSPTNYFLVAANEKIRVNCELNHVDVVLCCDPKAFLHTNPVSGLAEGGVFVFESSETPEKAWQRIPKKYRKEMIDKKIKFYILHGFEIAKTATDREDLQYRMQGNAFLGAFFRVSPLLDEYNIPEEEFLRIIRKQYDKKFGKFGESVIESNMKIMRAGFENVIEVKVNDLEAPDFSSMTGELVDPSNICGIIENDTKANLFSKSYFEKEFRGGYGYDQPASPLASVGIVAAGTGSAASKYMSRKYTPVFKPENCTQCMDCITVCPDTALPNTAQDLTTLISTIINNYVGDGISRRALLTNVHEFEKQVRAEMLTELGVAGQKPKQLKVILKEIFTAFASQNTNVIHGSLTELIKILDILPLAYEKTNAIFKNIEKKKQGEGGVFSIFVSDLCKGCGACVESCGHNALEMVEENPEIHAEHLSAERFLELLPDTQSKYLGIYNNDHPEDSKAAALRYHLMVQSKYKSFMSGDGACAGCGEKSVLRSVSTLTEALMRPIYHRKAERFDQKAEKLKELGVSVLSQLKIRDEASYNIFRRSILHILMGFGGADLKDTQNRIEKEFKGDDETIIDALFTILKQESYNHKDLQTIEGAWHNGMSVMAMAAHTGCNTVFSSTPPNNPHPYPWMNSLFQDGSTIGWLLSESFVQNHSRRSVIPERFVDLIINNFEHAFTEEDYFQYTHFSDLYMSDQEIMELPKVWVIGGDGGMGDIGFQNVSKVVMQNRPNVKLLMLDTQVYSNTGGQNSDSSVLLGGFDMNQFGKVTEGKLTEMKDVSQCFLGGHGSPFVAQVSMGGSATLYKSIIDAMCYRGTAFIQTYTTCQPEHGVPDHASVTQAQKARDSRSFPEFVFNPQLGENYSDSLNLKGNPMHDRDWYMKVIPSTTEKFAYTAAHWALTEARFKSHFKKVKKEAIEGLTSLEEKIKYITMNDIVFRKFIDKNHRAFIPDFKIYMVNYTDDGTPEYYLVSKQLVIFCVERRKAWRSLQSMSGIANKDYEEQKTLLK